MPSAFSSTTIARVPARRGTARRALLAAALLGLSACSSMMPSHEQLRVSSNRQDGEGYAGVGELVLRLGVSPHDETPVAAIHNSVTVDRRQTASVELRYKGLDSAGRAVFERHDADTAASPAAEAEIKAKAGGAGAAAADARAARRNTRDIVLDLRTTRQIHVQGRTIEVLEASPSGVTFRLYTSTSASS